MKRSIRNGVRLWWYCSKKYSDVVSMCKYVNYFYKILMYVNLERLMSSVWFELLMSSETQISIFDLTKCLKLNIQSRAFTRFLLFSTTFMIQLFRVSDKLAPYLSTITMYKDTIAKCYKQHKRLLRTTNPFILLRHLVERGSLKVKLN